MTTPAPTGAKRKLATKPFSLVDRVFFGIATSASGVAIALVVLVLVFLLASSAPALQQQGVNFVVGSEWDNTLQPPVFQMGPMLYGTFLIAFLGMVLAVPLSIAIAYFIEFLASGWVSKVATVLIDLLAAIPSIVIGLWGLLVFTPVGVHWSGLLDKYLGFIPIFDNQSTNFVGSPFIASWIVAVMIVPIISSVTREVFSQIDKDVIKAGLALGGSRAATFFQIILPTSAGGVVGGTLLGFGRALGETVAIFFVINLSFGINWYELLEARSGSIASLIVARFGEATGEELQALMAAGLVLFVLTLIVNWLAAVIVDKAQPWRKA